MKRKKINVKDIFITNSWVVEVAVDHLPQTFGQALFLERLSVLCFYLRLLKNI